MYYIQQMNKSKEKVLSERYAKTADEAAKCLYYIGKDAKESKLLDKLAYQTTIKDGKRVYTSMRVISQVKTDKPVFCERLGWLNYRVIYEPGEYKKHCYISKHA